VLTLVSGGFCVQCTWLDDVFVVDRFVLFTAVWLLGAVVFFVNPFITPSGSRGHFDPTNTMAHSVVCFLLKGFRAEP